ncbi:MAG: hypothetical protein Phog2KO_07750 [Phototrophicaceae bacterium]
MNTYLQSLTVVRKVLYLLIIITILVLTTIWTYAQDSFFPENLSIINSDNLDQLQPLTIDDNIKQIVFSPDNSRVAIAQQTLDFDFSVEIISNSTNEIIITIQGRMDSFKDLIWSPDSERVAIISSRRTGGGIENYTVKTYIIESGSYILGNNDALLSLDYPATVGDTPIYISWHPNEDLIAVGFRDELRLFDTITSEVYLTLDILNIMNISWGDNGAILLVEADELIALTIQP